MKSIKEVINEVVGKEVEESSLANSIMNLIIDYDEEVISFETLAMTLTKMFRLYKVNELTDYFGKPLND